MLKLLLSGLAVWMLIVACYFVASEASAPTPRDETVRALSAGGDETSPALHRTDLSAGRQMQTFQRHARANMILYTGRLGRARAAKTTSVDVVTLRLRPVRK